MVPLLSLIKENVLFLKPCYRLSKPPPKTTWSLILFNFSGSHLNHLTSISSTTYYTWQQGQWCKIFLCVARFRVKFLSWHCKHSNYYMSIRNLHPGWKWCSLELIYSEAVNLYPPLPPPPPSKGKILFLKSAWYQGPLLGWQEDDRDHRTAFPCPCHHTSCSSQAGHLHQLPLPFDSQQFAPLLNPCPCHRRQALGSQS